MQQYKLNIFTTKEPTCKPEYPKDFAAALSYQQAIDDIDLNNEESIASMAHWLPPREIEHRVELIRNMVDSYNRFYRIVAGIIGAVVGFILGYFT